LEAGAFAGGLAVCVGAWLAAVCLPAIVGAALAAGRADGLPAWLLVGLGSGLADSRFAVVLQKRADWLLFPAAVFLSVVADRCAAQSRILACATAHR